MESSPLTQQTRPDVFEPKIAQLYLHLFSVDDESVLSEGFWRELFLLRPDKRRLVHILSVLDAEDLLQLQVHTRTLFRRAVTEVSLEKFPADEHALETLTAFLSAVLTKRYTNPSSDAIEVLAGLDNIDHLVSGLVNCLERIIRSTTRSQLRQNAIETALCLTASAYQTSLVTYLINRDLFPAIVKTLQDDEVQFAEAFLLLGLLANYNKFEFQNPYQNRMEDFVNESVMQQIVNGIGKACSEARDAYINVHDDLPEAWNLSSTLSFIGLRALAPDQRSKTPPPTEEEAKDRFGVLPPLEATIGLPVYSFVHANKIFASTLASATKGSNNEAPFASFLSVTSYLTHHAHRSSRTAQYAVLNLLSIRIMVEDQILIKRLSSDELKVTVRLCRHRMPNLPLITTDRIPPLVMLDICTDVMRYNLKRRLDTQLYGLALGIVLRIVYYLGSSKTRLKHHWSHIWGASLTLIKFLTQYAADLARLPQIRDDICTPLADLIAFCLSRGDSFLPDPASYDDLFYKLVESREALAKFRDAYFGSTTNGQGKSTDILISVSTHYHDLLQAQHGRKVHQSPAAVQKVIQDGYETLTLEPDEESGQWERWREMTWKAELKKIIRTVVEDARKLVER